MEKERRKLGPTAPRVVERRVGGESERRQIGGDGAQKGDGSSRKGTWAGHQRTGPDAVELVLTQLILRSAVSRYPVTNPGGTAAVVSSPIRHVTPRPQVHGHSASAFQHVEGAKSWEQRKRGRPTRAWVRTGSVT